MGSSENGGKKMTNTFLCGFPLGYFLGFFTAVAVEIMHRRSKRDFLSPDENAQPLTPTEGE